MAGIFSIFAAENYFFSRTQTLPFMKKRLLFMAVAAFACTAASAQLTETDKVKKSLSVDNKDTIAWVHSGIFQAGLNEGLLHNWSAGGEVASLTVNAVFSGNLTRLYHTDVWSNDLNMAYSLFYAYSNHFVPKKIDDRIDFTSKYGKQIRTGKPFYITSLFNFKSQFTKGYDYTIKDWRSSPITDFMSPAYFTLALGLEYRKGTDLSIFLSPVAARVTTASTKYTSKQGGAFGIEEGKTSRFELGAYFSARYNVDVSKNMNFKTRLDLYSNYLARNKADDNGRITHDNPGNVDVYFDNLLAWKLSKHFATVIGVTMIYDNDFPYSKTYIDKTTNLEVEKDEPAQGLGWLQFRQLFTLGFEYKF